MSFESLGRTPYPFLTFGGHYSAIDGGHPDGRAGHDPQLYEFIP